MRGEQISKLMFGNLQSLIQVLFGLFCLSLLLVIFQQKKTSFLCLYLLGDVEFVFSCFKHVNYYFVIELIVTTDNKIFCLFFSAFHC